MRFVITSFITLLVATMYFVDQPAHWEKVSKKAQSELQRWLYDKDIAIEGLTLLPEQRVRAMLPVDRSVVWWKTNHALIEGQLLQSSLISRAALSECGWGCFRVSIEERTPAFFTVVGNRGWIVGQDGGVIKPIAIEKITAYLDGGIAGGSGAASAGALGELQIPVVTGLLAGDGSSDIVRSRFEHVRNAVEIVQSVTGRRVATLEFVYGKELRMRFFEVPFPVVFAAGEEESDELLRDQSERLKHLIKELEGSLTSIRSVDLGFEKLAVITPVEAPKPAVKQGGKPK